MLFSRLYQVYTCFGLWYCTYSNYLCCTPDIAQVETTFTIFRYHAVWVTQDLGLDQWKMKCSAPPQFLWINSFNIYKLHYMRIRRYIPCFAWLALNPFNFVSDAYFGQDKLGKGYDCPVGLEPPAGARNKKNTQTYYFYFWRVFFLFLAPAGGSNPARPYS